MRSTVTITINPMVTNTVPKVSSMIDSFILYGLLGGIGIAIVGGPLGCFVVWRRMAYFGDSLAHSALLGVALGFLLGINLSLGITLICVGFAVTIVFLQEQKNWPRTHYSASFRMQLCQQALWS